MIIDAHASLEAFLRAHALGASGVWMGSYWLTTAEYQLTTGDNPIQTALVRAVPEIRSVVDVTDHQSGTNPYFEAAKK